MLSLDRVSKSYKVGLFGGTDLPAVRDVSFSLQPGEVISLIGESGSGKSTIGKMILRLLSVNRGTISHDGTDISTLRGTALRAYYRTVQGVFQDPFSSFNPIFKADHVFGLIRGVYFGSASAAEWERRVDEALQAVTNGRLEVSRVELQVAANLLLHAQEDDWVPQAALLRAEHQPRSAETP